MNSVSVSFLGIVAEQVLAIALSLVLGCIMGQLLHFTEQFFHSRGKRMSLSVAFVPLTVGLSMLKLQIGTVHIGFSLLLVCMMTGTVFCNICSTSEELTGRIEGWTVPIIIL